MDLKAYTCRGFPGDFDRLMRDVPVAGIDREQTQSMVRLCKETEAVLYGLDFSPRRIRYHHGARPKLEKIAAVLGHDPTAGMHWVRDHVKHPHFAGHVAPDRGITEEQLIESGRGWCNEQCRVFIALCEVMEIPARLCFLFHANSKTAHTAAEALIGERWSLVDVTYGIQIPLPDGRLAEGRELQGAYRALAHRQYESPLVEYYRDRESPINLTRGGDLFASIGICNYLIDGVEACL